MRLDANAINSNPMNANLFMQFNCVLKNSPKDKNAKVISPHGIDFIILNNLEKRKLFKQRHHNLSTQS